MVPIISPFLNESNDVDDEHKHGGDGDGEHDGDGDGNGDSGDEMRKRQIQWNNDDRTVHQFSGSRSSGISAFVLYLLNCKFVFARL